LEGILLESLQKSQVRTVYLVFDILPILLPEFFPRNIPEEHLKWCKIAIQSDLIICISKKGMSDLLKFFKKENLANKLDYVYPGADFSDHRNQIIKKNNKDTDSITEFVMVGTLEPRKNYTKVLRVFQTLWDRNEKVKLTLIGKEGWNVNELMQVIDTLKIYYPDKFNWLQSASDTDLNNLLFTSDCLIQASIDEGFGIPVMEAAHFGINLILNDIEIFREIAGNGAYYINFENPNPEEILSQILNWRDLFKTDNHPKSELIETRLWKQSSKLILEKAINVN
jgi:glycosyltransferase involved in cell wall biosynthesis